MCASVCTCNVDFCYFARPGGELVAGEDEIDGLKRSMTEVNIFLKY